MSSGASTRRDLQARWPGFFPIRVVSIGVSRLMLWWRRIPSFGRRCSAVRRSGCPGWYDRRRDQSSARRYVKRRVFVRPLKYKSGLDPTDRTKEVHLADIDAVVAEDREGHHDMEINVREPHLTEEDLAPKALAGCPGEADLPLGGTGVLRFRHALRECDGLVDAGAPLIDRLLIILVLGRRLPGEPSRRRLDVVTCALNLVDEWLHVGREAAGHQDADIKRLGARVLLSLVEPAFEILQHLRALRNGLVIHCFLPFV